MSFIILFCNILVELLFQCFSGFINCSSFSVAWKNVYYRYFFLYMFRSIHHLCYQGWQFLCRCWITFSVSVLDLKLFKILCVLLCVRFVRLDSSWIWIFLQFWKIALNLFSSIHCSFNVCWMCSHVLFFPLYW